jgi:hypothetical protein
VSWTDETLTFTHEAGVWSRTPKQLMEENLSPGCLDEALSVVSK